MKTKNVKIAIVALFLTSSFAMAEGGGETGNGGSGLAGIFVGIGRVFYNSLAAQPFDPSAVGKLDIDKATLKEALDNTEVVIGFPDDQKNNSELKDVKGKAQTCIFDYQHHTIYVDPSKFTNELKNPGVVMTTVVHEYFRAMGLNDNNYRVVSQAFSEGFFVRALQNEETLAIFNQTLSDVKLDNFSDGVLQSANNSPLDERSQKMIDFLDKRDHEIRDLMRSESDEFAKISIKYDVLQTNQLQEKLKIMAGMTEALGRVTKKMSAAGLASHGGSGTYLGELMIGEGKVLEAGAGVTVRENEQDYIVSQIQFLKEDLTNQQARVVKYETAIDKIIDKSVDEILKN